MVGDVYFIRRLHKCCERETGLILKRYMKYRQIKETLLAQKSLLASLSVHPLSVKSGGSSVSSPAVPVTALDSAVHTSLADLHTTLDEMAILLQYCSSYAGKQPYFVCVGVMTLPYLYIFI